MHESALLPDEGRLGTVEIEWLLVDMDVVDVDMDVGDFGIRDSVTLWLTDVATIESVEFPVSDIVREGEGVVFTTKSKLFN